MKHNGCSNGTVNGSRPSTRPQPSTSSVRSRISAYLLAFTSIAGLGVSVSHPRGLAQQATTASLGTPNQNCVATLENRSVNVGSDGTYALPNIPVNLGQFRSRVVCQGPNGMVLGSTSAFLNLIPLGINEVPLLPLVDMSNSFLAQPTALKLQVINGALTSLGATAQLETQAINPANFAVDATLTGTTYTSSNPSVATVNSQGLVTAVGPGNVVISARNDGLVSTLVLSSFGLLDSDGDGLPDAYEIANGLNPYDPSDATQDPDHDGLTNLQEFQLGTNPQVADTDGDGLNDGDEIKYGTNPLVADTDGDGLSDGDEIRLGTNPLVADTDGDGIPDGIEVKLGLNPLVPDVTTTVTGHVTNANGSPYAGASVSLLTYFTAVSDSTGAFTLLNIPTSLGNLMVAARAVQSGAVLSGSSKPTTPVGGGVTDVGSIPLGQGGGQVSGIVTGPDNKPVVNAQITAVGGSDTRTTTTDGSGLYAITGLQAGTVMIAVFDPATSLRGQATGTLSGAAPLTLNVKLSGFGTVAGTVRTPAGAPVGAGVTVTITGALNATTTTNTLGRYTFAFVPLGPVTVDATDTAGNHGRSTATITATAQNINLDVQYLGRGTVSGIISDGTGKAVAGAVVSLNNGGQFSQSLTATTNTLGQYSFSNIFVGTVYVSATSAAASTGGSTTTTLQSDGQTATANITLQLTGVISGTVYRHDGTTGVAGAQISIANTGYTATADSAGRYTVPNVPLGAYTMIAADTTTGDRGSTNVNLTTSGQTVTGNITLLGLGTLNVTVNDGGGTIVAGAVVTVTSSSVVYTSQKAVTGSNGVATFNQQLATALSLSATNPANGLSGTASATLTAGGTANVTITLQSAGTVQGTVYKLNGTTPVVGVTVALDQGQQVLTNASGQYTLSVVPSGRHAVYVLDAQGNVLSSNNNVVITTQGQTVTANFVIIARGTVTGHVTNPDGSAAAGVPVSVTSSSPGDGNPLGTQTDVNGVYTVQLVPAGAYTVVAQQHTATTNAYGTATGNLTGDGNTVTTDVRLSSSLVPSTTGFTDANGQNYTIRENGGIFNGSFSVFAGDGSGNQGASLLGIVQNGTTTMFTGAPFSVADLNARQISIEQDGLDGLNITRRIYVPGDGYFARYLELLKNPTTQDITVGVKLTSNFRRIVEDVRSPATITTVSAPHILLTSSGDTLLNAADPTTPDRWVTLGGPVDRDAFDPDQFADTPAPAIASVFSGPGAVLAPSGVVYTADANNNYATLTESYATVKVPAGSTVGILHFVSEENLYASANASAMRLVQLPPEALAGISTTDAATIKNFAIPAGGTSTLAALPGLNNQISGFVYASDGTTQIPGAEVHLQSTDPLFARTYIGYANAVGAYVFQGSYQGLAIPAENFHVYGSHPTTTTALTADCAQSGHYINGGCAIDSPVFTGTFNSAPNAAAQDIVFSNTGTLQGTISRGPTVLNVSGTVTISGGLLSGGIRIPIQANGTYSITGLPAGSYSLLAQVTNTLLEGIASTVITAGNTTTTNITIGPSGNIQGTVTRANGSLAVGDIVNLRVANANALQVYVDTAGHYMFTDIPTGTYTVDAYDSSTNSAASATVTVAASATSTQDLVLQSSGRVVGAVTVNDGSSVANLTVTLTSTTSNGTQTLTAVTDGTGNFAFSNVTPGTIMLRTTTPAGLQGASSGSLPLAGQTVTINISLTVAGSLSGTVFQADGVTPAAGIQVTLSPAPLTGSAVTTTDANGMYSFAVVRIGGFTVYATNPANGDTGQNSGQIQTNGQQRVINVTLNGFGNLTVKVVDGNSNPVAGAAVTLRNTSLGKTYTGTADTTGTAVFTNIFAGQYQLTARDAVTGLNNITYPTLAAGATQTTTIQLQPVGTLQGVVYQADGTTPAAGATVSIQYGPSVTTASDGSYKFLALALSGYNGYTLVTRDSNGTVRAVDSGVMLQHNGDTVTHNITFIGVGSAHGLVTQVDGTPLENATLSVQSQNATIGGTQTVTTGGDGTYNVPEIPIGKFTVTVSNLPASLSGFGSGTIAANNDSVTVNIQLVNSTVTLPLSLNDADGYTFRIQTDGSFGSSTALYGLSPFYNAQQLVLTNSGTAYNFGTGAAPTSALQSLSGQQIEINQPSLAGLSVTRKIYVPTDGYFSRRLEVLENTSSSPVTVSVTIQGLEKYTKNYPHVVTTSNGTATVDKNILWAVDSEESKTQYYPQIPPALASVFAGTGAPTKPSAITTTINNYGYPYYVNTENWTYAYNAVTIPANSKVSFLFFTAQEVGSATATTAAQRLVQLPAEALAGLTAAELASVVNFVIPTTPLAAVHQPAGGEVSGHVYAGDGTTPIPNAKVYVQSTDLQYGVGVSVTADGIGAYDVPAIAATNVAAEAQDPATTVVSPTFTGAFASSATTATLDIPFTNTGILRGLVKATGLTTFTGGSANLYVSSNGNYIGFNMNFGPDGVFYALTAPAGDDQIGANVTTAQGGSIHLPYNGNNFGVNIAAKQTTQFTFVLPATGSIAGKVTYASGAPAVGVTVYMGNNQGFGETTQTDANGNYTFTFIPVTTYTITSTDPTTSSSVAKNVTLTQDTTSTVNLQFIGKGSVVATVHYANGNIAANVQLTISTSTTPAYTYATAPTDGNGQYTFPVVPTGAYTVRAYYPNQNFYSVITGNLTADGQTQQLAVTLTPVGTISGKVTLANGSPAMGAYVNLTDNQSNGFNAYAQTDSAGNYGITPVPADRPITVYSDLPNNTTGKTIRATAANQQVPSDGATLTVNLRYPGQANVKVTALQKNGTPYTSGIVYLTSADRVQNLNATVDATGSATFSNIVEATFTAAFAPDFSNYYAGSKVFTVGPADDGTTVNVTIQTSAKGTVKGKVFASDGTTVILGSYNVQLLDIDTNRNYYADINGADGYSFTGVQVGASGFRLTAQLDNSTGKQTATGNITTEGQTVTQNFTLPVSSISGTVYLYDGVTVVPNASIYATQSINGNYSSFNGYADADGKFQISGPLAGVVNIGAYDSNGVAGTATTTLAADTSIVTGLKVKLDATGIVVGTVYDASGNPVNYNDLYISSTGSGGFSVSARTDISGSYSVSDIPVGDITVSATLPDGSQVSNTGTLVNNGDTITINLGNAPTTGLAHIFGTVYDSNQNPSEGATVTAIAANGNVTVTATTDNTGMYVITGLPTGAVTVSGTLADGTVLNSVTGDVPDITNAVEFDLGLNDSGYVSGIIYDHTGKPMPGVDVFLSSTGDSSTTYSESTASDGSYVFSTIAPGTITVTVVQNGQTIGTMTGKLPYGGNVAIDVNTTGTAKLTPPRFGQTELPVLAGISGPPRTPPYASGSVQQISVLQSIPWPGMPGRNGGVR